MGNLKQYLKAIYNDTFIDATNTLPTCLSVKFFLLIAAWLRSCIAATLASLEKIQKKFFQYCIRGTEPKEASYAGTGVTT